MKNLKNTLFLTGLLICSLSMSTFAQRRPTGGQGQGMGQRPNAGHGQFQGREMNERPQPGPRMEKLESAKIGFLTQKLDLSPREAEKFWPIYNQYQNEMKDLAKERMAARKAGEQTSADQKLDEQMELEGRVLEIRKKYTREFTRVIPSEKVVRLYEAEKQFRQELIKRLQERK